MAHLLLLRGSVSFVQSPDGICGEHELIEEAINSRRYALKKGRDGYNIPFGTEWKILEYRIKKECIPEFVRDLNGRILNPEINKTRLWDVIWPSKKISEGDSFPTIGRLQLFMMWIFRWFNRINKLLNIIPLQPVPTPAPGKPERFSIGWSYNFLIGVLADKDVGKGEEL